MSNKTSRYNYMRRRQVCAFLGIRNRMLTKLVDAGIIRQVFPFGARRAYYSRSQIVKSIRAGRLFVEKESGVVERSQESGVRSQEKGTPASFPSPGSFHPDS